MVLVERDPPSELQELIALCTAETFNFLCEPDKAEWLVGEIVSELPLPPHAARPLARYAVKLLAQAADAQAMAGAGWVARKAAQLAVALLQRLPYSDKLCRAIAGRLRKLNSDVLARHEAERAIAEAGYKVDPELAQRLSLDLRADLRQLEMIEELRDQVSGIEAALGAEHQDLKDYLNESLNPQPPLHMPLIVDDEQARFVFRARRVPFVGRARELLALRRLLDHEAPFRWWLATGPAGTGKSRLALEFCMRAPNPWRAGFLASDTDFDRFEHWQPSQPTLLVIDYAARAPKRVGRWLRQLAHRQQSDRPLQAPIRVLLLERAKQDDWWRDLMGADSHGLRQSLYADVGGGLPLVLADSAADREEIAWHTVDSLFRAAGRTPPEPATTMAGLAAIDARLAPLVAAFAADALLAGKDIRGWDRTRLIEDVIDRSRERLWRPTADRLGADLARHELLLRLATLTQGLPLDVLKEPPAGLRLPARDPEDEYGFCALLYNAMVAGGSAEAGMDVLQPLEPDILGAVFVLTAPGRLRNDPSAHRQQLENLALAAWTVASPPSMFSFLDPTAIDFFPSQELSALLHPPDASAEQSAGWCRIAVNVLARADTPEKLTEAGTVLGSLHRLAQNWPQHVEITRLLATGIYNLANQFAKQGHLQAAGAGIRELCLVAGRYYGRADIAEVLATGLVNYCGDMGRIGELEAAGSCVEELRLVARRWPAHADIADKLSRGLYNYGVSLAAANRLDAASACLWELRQLAQRWPGHADLLDAAQSLDQIIASAGD